MRKLLIILLLCLLAPALLALGIWWGNNSIETDAYTFATKALPEGFDGLRIVHLSDLHGKQFGEGNERLSDAVRDAAPDLIALTGDFVDEKSKVSDVLPLIDALTDIAPVYYVTGNHEWASGQAKEMVLALRERGVTCLENEFVPFERDGQRILIAGVHDPNGYADQKTPEEMAQELYAAETNPFWLLLAHRNNLFNGKYCRLGANLTLCGHAHGGVWRLPFTDGLINTEMQLFPSFTSGFYRCTDQNCEGAWVFVSRGLGNTPRQTLPRLFNRPQVAVITLLCE